ncbi:MAG: GNAT family N-acetyltransferase [Defluviitaleaceae bacterium]|nr:GNAT family N-acetyltransferase [Defluviitaleaceae bacterium]
MEIIFNNRNNPAYETMFNDLIQDVFGFSFAPWFEHLPWENCYESHSIVENGVMLSNVCVYKADIVINGKGLQAIQLGAVATRKSARGRGLSRMLMEHILSLYPNTPVYLYANPSVVGFYPRFGFKQAPMYKPEIGLKIDNDPAKAIKYNFDDPSFVSVLNGERCRSNIVDCINSQPIQMFHLMASYSNHIYHLPSLDIVVIAKQKDKRLLLADVIAKKPVAFELIKQELPFAGVDTVEFGFCPDWLGVEPTWVLQDTDKEPFFIKGDWDLPEKYRFPVMSET